MKAPDKIYVTRAFIADNELELNEYEQDIEYIRKDALLEWLQQARQIPHENSIARDLAFQEVINKINSM